MRKREKEREVEREGGEDEKWGDRGRERGNGRKDRDVRGGGEGE